MREQRPERAYRGAPRGRVADAVSQGTSQQRLEGRAVGRRALEDAFVGVVAAALRQAPGDERGLRPEDDEARVVGLQHRELLLERVREERHRVPCARDRSQRTKDRQRRRSRCGGRLDRGQRGVGGALVQQLERVLEALGLTRGSGLLLLATLGAPDARPHRVEPRREPGIAGQRFLGALIRRGGCGVIPDHQLVELSCATEKERASLSLGCLGQFDEPRAEGGCVLRQQRGDGLREAGPRRIQRVGSAE